MPLSTPRYLVPFDAGALPQTTTDVLVIGGGVAGLSCAIEAGRAGLNVLVVNKGIAGESNTQRAQGGIAATVDGDPGAVESHIQDTLATGDGLCDEAAVRAIIGASTDAIAFLSENRCRFDLDGAGHPAIGQEAAHSLPRILHCGGDATGAEISRSLLAAAARVGAVARVDEVFVLDLLVQDGRCVGALVSRDGSLQVISAGAVVLASGGCGRLFRESSNSRIATGDGHAMAIRAGVVVRDLELVQFHPTLFYVAGAPRTLVTEALRGAGALLRNSAGDRLMERYDERLELAPRDIVARSIESEMRRTGDSAAFLDVTGVVQTIGLSETERRFPSFARLCRKFEIDIAKSWVPVRPGPHYMIGGVETDMDAASSLPGLFAVGEAASSGLHGANRLASNSLLEGVVTGRRLGKRLAAAKARPARLVTARADREVHHRRIVYSDLRNALKSLVQRQLGVERSRIGMDQLLRRIEPWQRLVFGAHLSGRKPWELANMLMLAEAMARSAVCREESRGVHFRVDFPAHDERMAMRHVRYLLPEGAQWDSAPRLAITNASAQPRIPTAKTNPVPVVPVSGACE
jgi:L-aspartate oxidase